MVRKIDCKETKEKEAWGLVNRQISAQETMVTWLTEKVHRGLGDACSYISEKWSG